MKRYTIITPSAAPYETVEDSEGVWVKYEEVIAKFGDKCQCCGEYGQDRRTLYMACSADMGERSIPFGTFDCESLPGFNRRQLYTLRVCKECRSQWLQTIEEWFKRGGQT